ncbi:hypothetical protein BC826DRAFT_1148673 [Russula brevipes]|nr:hypothetical protein BC826DRAFT_1148673 [Russula brevipes]
MDYGAQLFALFASQPFAIARVYGFAPPLSLSLAPHDRSVDRSKQRKVIRKCFGCCAVTDGRRAGGRIASIASPESMNGRMAFPPRRTDEAQPWPTLPTVPRFNGVTVLDPPATVCCLCGHPASETAAPASFLRTLESPVSGRPVPPSPLGTPADGALSCFVPSTRLSWLRFLVTSFPFGATPLAEILTFFHVSLFTRSRGTMGRLSSLCGDITRTLDYNPGPPFATRRDATAPSPQDFEVWAPGPRSTRSPSPRFNPYFPPLSLYYLYLFFFHLPAALRAPHILIKFPVTKVKKGGQHFAQSSSRPALSSIHTASVDRRCAGQLALHTASTVHSYWTTSLGPSGLEHASESESEVTEVPQIRRLRTLKMCASGFAFMRDGSLPQQWAWFNWSKVFRVRVSVHATIRVHRAAVPFFSLCSLLLST